MESTRATALPNGGIEGEREVFERVWSRVVPEGRESPVVVTPVGRNTSAGQGGAAAKAPKTASPKAAAISCDLTAKEYEMIPARGSMAMASCQERTHRGESVCPMSRLDQRDPPAEGMVEVQTKARMEGQMEDVPVLTGTEAQGNEVVCELAKLETGLCTRDVRGRARPVTERDHCASDFPPRSAVPWLGSCGPSFEGLLQEMIRKEISDWNYYRTLARKTGGTAAKTLSAMAAEEWHCAKRLCAAYFLSSGIYYWPDKTGKLNFTSYMGALRERFLEEQQDAETYSAASAECQDECLCQIFEEIAGLDRTHAYRIRLLVEQM